MRICIFAYEFPHFKSEYGLMKLLAHGFDVSGVIAQPYKSLKVPRSKFRIAPMLPASGSLENMCASNEINYLVAEHDSESAYSFVRNIGADIGLILGARILKPATIDRFELGILNIHPGEIPGNRGLDNFKWALINRLPMINSAHLIDQSIDLGRLVCSSETPLFMDDELWDFYLRHHFGEYDLMIESLSLMESGYNDFKDVEQISGEGRYYSAVPDHLDEQMLDFFELYKDSFC